MASAAEYRKHAGECRALARNAQNDQQRNQLLKMADAWDNFAMESDRAARARQNVAAEFPDKDHSGGTTFQFSGTILAHGS
jgi:hypothetical protein